MSIHTCMAQMFAKLLPVSKAVFLFWALEFPNDVLTSIARKIQL
jgi:hypothetical protein